MRKDEKCALTGTPSLTPLFGHNSGAQFDTAEKPAPIPRLQQQGDYVPLYDLSRYISDDRDDDTYRPSVWTCPYGI
jgi:hypothetical protein